MFTWSVIPWFFIPQEELDTKRDVIVDRNFFSFKIQLVELSEMERHINNYSLYEKAFNNSHLDTLFFNLSWFWHPFCNACILHPPMKDMPFIQAFFLSHKCSTYSFQRKWTPTPREKLYIERFWHHAGQVDSRHNNETQTTSDESTATWTWSQLCRGDWTQVTHRGQHLQLVLYLWRTGGLRSFISKYLETWPGTSAKTHLASRAEDTCTGENTGHIWQYNDICYKGGSVEGTLAINSSDNLTGKWPCRLVCNDNFYFLEVN